MKGIESIIEKALSLKAKGLTDKEIGDELHLSPNTITWLLTRKVEGEKPPMDIKIGWRSVGVFPHRIESLATIMSDIILEEMTKQKKEIDSIVGVALNGIPFATLIALELQKELIIFRPPSDSSAKGTFSSNYAGVKGKKAVIVDDVLGTGDSVRNTISTLKDHGAKPVLTVVVLNKTEHDKIGNVPLRALFRARILE
ncbi:MAG: orotate phosphoribosyltransferase-like protein [Thermoplasmata archaeon]|nr:MAG: orotate phosphoribosyltransferase-like protein [Thermoplasmata archaeon]